MKMKRRLYIPGLAIAILTLVQCSVEEKEALFPLNQSSVPFEVIATNVDTKTVNEGKSMAPFTTGMLSIRFQRLLILLMLQELL